MALTLTTSSFQTVAGPTRLPYTPDPASMAYQVDEPGKALIVNTAAPLTQPNSIRLEVSTVNDVFARSPVQAGPEQRKDGLSLLVEVNEVWMVNDPANTAVLPYYLPIKAHMVLRLPNDTFVTSANVASLVQRLEGAMQRAAAQTLADGLTNPLHGVVRY